ncbi:hypothetical protein ACQKWADRAFT_282643 [Trichoderma austrokoningii]
MDTRISQFTSHPPSLHWPVHQTIPRYFQEQKPKTPPASPNLESDSPYILGTIFPPLSVSNPYTVLLSPPRYRPRDNSTMLHDAPRFRNPEAQVNPSQMIRC